MRLSIIPAPQRAARQIGAALIWRCQACAGRTAEATLPVQNAEERSSSTDLHQA